jgi:predicted MFS family arabinose efflux permease
MQAATFYLISFFMLFIYITQVCHRITETNVHYLILSLLIVFGVGLSIRHYIIKFIVDKADSSTQVLKQFITEFSIFIAMSVVFIIYISQITSLR